MYGSCPSAAEALRPYLPSAGGRPCCSMFTAGQPRRRPSCTKWRPLPWHSSRIILPVPCVFFRGPAFTLGFASLWLQI